jgi:mono/diheme cytochrome c family protein
MRMAPAFAGAAALVASSVVLAATAGPSPVPAAPPAVATPAAANAETDKYKALLTRYCVSCHNTRNPTAGLAFNTMDLGKIGEDGAVWEKVSRKLRGRMMPPPGSSRPDDATYTAFVDFLEGHLDREAERAPDPGRVALHRLNRKEYANAVRDLFGLKVNPAALLPQDDTSDSFDNIAEVLQVSAAFLDQYINAADKIAIEAVGDGRLKYERVVIKPDPGLSQGAYIPGLPLGTRGGIVVDYVIPADGDYDLIFNGPGYGRYDDLLRPDRFVALVDGRIVYDSAKDDVPVDESKLAAGVPLSERHTTVRVHLTAGTHKLGGTYFATPAVAQKWTLESLKPQVGVVSHVLSDMQVAGPIRPEGAKPAPLGRTPSRDRIFICRPAKAAQEEACARKIVAKLARRAFRRPVTAAEMDARLRFYREGHRIGGFETGVQHAIMSILVSPSFLYRTTTVPKGLPVGAAFPLNDIDLASRLSFFLWSSIPDEQLLKVAEQGRLKDPKVLEAQVRRMLADPRADSLAGNFAFQWLHLEPMETLEPDPALFPQFDNSLRAAFAEETKLFVDSVFRENQSVLKLLTADYTFVNERLARHYGIRNVTGNSFRRVQLDNPVRYGLLGKGAVLFATSYGDRTAPVIRGAWLLENIMGTPPSPPPPNVEGFPENVVGEKTLTIRALLAQHRSNAACNACHGIMDPLGLSLENFDAVGEWRTKDRFAGEPIDASATMVNGDKLNGVVDLRTEIMKRPDQFVQTLTEKLMTYGIGRSMNYRDMPTVRAIVRKSAPSNYRFADIVMGIVQSEQFRTSKVPGKPGATQVATASTAPARAK